MRGLHRSAWISLSVVLTGGFFAPWHMPSVWAKIAQYQTRTDDTSATIAQRYFYGEIGEFWLLAMNEWKTTSSSVRLGKVVRVPRTTWITLSTGDSLPVVAKKHLGLVRRADFIARINQLDPQSLNRGRAGERIRIPEVVRYRLPRTSSWEEVAKQTFGDTSAAFIIAGYNEAALDSVIPAGHLVALPFFDRCTEARSKNRRNMSLRTLLKESQELMRSGEFTRATTFLRRALGRCEAVKGPQIARILLLQELARSYLARGRTEDASYIYRKIVAISPKFEVSSDGSPFERLLAVKARQEGEKAHIEPFEFFW